MMSSSSGRLLTNNFRAVFRVTSPKHLTPAKKHFHQRNSSSLQQTNVINETDKFSYFTPTEGYVRTSQFDPVVIPDLTLDKYVWEDFHKWQNHIAATCVVTGREYTYAQLRDHSAALALRLQQNFKLEPRDVVAVCLPNVPEYPIAFLGSIEAGLIVTTVNPVYTADEISRQLTGSNTKFVIVSVAGYSTLQTACEIANIKIPICCIRTSNSEALPEGAIDFYQLANPENCDFSQLKRNDIAINDMVALPYSSGTTGLPKGVMLSHSNMTVNCEMVQSKSPFPPLVIDTTEQHQDVIPCLLPFFHIYGLAVVMISKLRMGCKLVTMPRFTPEDLIKSLYDHKGSVLNLVPPIVLFLTNSPKVEKKHLEHLRIVMSGAAPIGALDAEKLVKKHPQINFIQGFGMTETSPVALMGHVGLKKYASVGFPVAGTEVKIAALDSENRTGLGPHAVGEICIRGPQVMAGYLNNDEATKEIFLDGNWLRTGDVGYYDDEGYFFITDRMKELIKVKGFQVPPAELEELLRDHPKIVDAAVIGVPHDQHGEVPRAFVVLRPNVDATEKEIQEYIADKVTAYKRLDGGVTFLTEIPKNVSGKILRRELKLKYC